MTQPGNISILLEKLGRSSTPAVPESSFNLSLGKLIGGSSLPSAEQQTIVLGTSILKDALSLHYKWINAIPGILVEQADFSHVSRLIIDSNAFNSGPWLGSDTGGAIHLREEIFEAGRVIRERGGTVILIPNKTRNLGIDFPRIESTANAILGSISTDEYEEEASNSKLWNICEQVFAQKNF